MGQPVPEGLEAIGVQSAEIFLAEWQITVSRRGTSPFGLGGGFRRRTAPFGLGGRFRKGSLKSGEFDLNATPDLFPALAAAACYAKGDTALVNIAHVRLKETDRIAVMARELGKLGVKTTEQSDGLIIHGDGGIFKNSETSAGKYRIDGHGDHRVVMALAAAALGCPLPVEISGFESAAISYPGFAELMGAEPVQSVR